MWSKFRTPLLVICGSLLLIASCPTCMIGSALMLGESEAPEGGLDAPYLHWGFMVLALTAVLGYGGWRVIQRAFEQGESYDASNTMVIHRVENQK